MNTFELYSQLIDYFYPEAKKNGLNEIRKLFPKKEKNDKDDITFEVKTLQDRVLKKISDEALNDLEGFEDRLSSMAQIRNLASNAIRDIHTFIHGSSSGSTAFTKMTEGTDGMGKDKGLVAAIIFSYLFLTNDSLINDIEKLEEKIKLLEIQLHEIDNLQKRQSEDENKINELLSVSVFKDRIKDYLEITKESKESAQEKRNKLCESYKITKSKYENALKKLDSKKADLRKLLSNWLTILGINNSDFLFDDTDVFVLNEKTSESASIPCRILIVSLVALFKMARSEDETDIENTKTAFRELFDRKFSSYFRTKNIFKEAEEILFKSIEKFIPRGTNEIRTTTDLYVLPSFTNQKNPSHTLKKGNNVLLIGASGLGKSMYASVFSACAFNATNNIDNVRYGEISKNMDIDFRKHVIMLSSKMINSYLHNNNEIDNVDFVQIFLKKIFDQGKNINYYYDGEAFGIETAIEMKTDLNTVRDYLKPLSKEIVFVLDAFDEIPEESRKEYYEILEITKSVFQNATFLVTSRALSENTMNNLKGALGDHAEIEIMPFEQEQQEKLLDKWKTVLKISEDDSKYNALYNLIKEDRFARQFASNPFMLSILANNYVSTNSIKKIIQDSSDQFCRLFKTKYNNHRFNEINPKIGEIIKKLSLISLKKTNGAVEKDEILNIFKDYDKTFEKSIGNYLELIVADFLSGIGLIVPCEKSDEKYTFINKCIAYELGSQQLLYIEKDESFLDELDCIFSDINNYEILEPLLCSIGIDDTDKIIQLLTYIKEKYYESKSPEEKGRIKKELKNSLGGGYSDRENIFKSRRYKNEKNNNTNITTIKKTLNAVLTEKIY